MNKNIPTIDINSQNSEDVLDNIPIPLLFLF